MNAFLQGEMTDELEVKAEQMLEELTKAVTEGPSSLLVIYANLREQFKGDPQNLKAVDELSREFMAKIPDIAGVVSDAAKVLETYLSYRISKRQEKATETVLSQNASLVKQNKILSYSTVFLALATFGLVLVTVFLR